MTRDGRGGAPLPDADPAPAICTATKQHDPPEDIRSGRSAGAVAIGFVSGPVGRRTLPLTVVVRCPACSRVHTHRGDEGGRRVGSCGASYTVRIAGGQRDRWSA